MKFQELLASLTEIASSLSENLSLHLKSHSTPNMIKSLNNILKKNSLWLITLYFFSCNNHTELTAMRQTGTISQGSFLNPKIGFEFHLASSTPGKPIKFNVADVQIAEDLLLTSDSKKIFENKLGKEIKYMPAENEGQNYVFAHGNIFIETIQQSFDEHRPLLISPDAIWLTICQGVSIHINENFDSLETLIFKKDRPKELIIRKDSLEKGEKEWAKLITSLSEETSLHVNNDYHSFFVPKFSTTTSSIKTAYEITLMHSFKKAFTYVGESGCGIPSITLTGNRYDWTSIQTKLSLLDELGLKDWRIELEPIIAEFIHVFDGKINVEFWNSMYKNMSDYGAFYVSGWIIKLFPYIETKEDSGEWDDEMGGQRTEILYAKNKFIEGDKYLLSTLSTGDFPSGILDIDIRWDNYYKNTTENMNVCGGFFAIKQHDDMTLEPVISWAIYAESAKSAAYDLPGNPSKKIKHKEELWSPTVVKKVTNKPIFMPQKFDNSEESILHLTSILKDSLKANFNYPDLVTKEISFIVLSNGQVENITFSGAKNVQTYLATLLKSYNGDWFPALARVSDLLMMWREFYEDGEIKVKVNYKFDILLD